MHHVTTEHMDGVVVVVARGELDAFAAPDLSAALAEEGVTAVVVDLESATFLDSTALGVVIHAVRELETNGGRSKVVLPRGSARRIFELTTLDRVLPVAPSRPDALSALTSAARDS